MKRMLDIMREVDCVGRECSAADLPSAGAAIVEDDQVVGVGTPDGRSADVEYAFQDELVSDVAARFQRCTSPAILVVTRRKRLVGIVRCDDLARHALEDDLHANVTQ